MNYMMKWIEMDNAEWEKRVEEWLKIRTKMGVGLKREKGHVKIWNDYHTKIKYIWSWKRSGKGLEIGTWFQNLI